MDETVREHVLMLQNLADRLTARLLHAKTNAEQQQIEGKLKAVDAALYHLRAALDLELLLDDVSRRTNSSVGTMSL
jgi:hypothetical protein